jgi:RNA polymerase sigma factor for flagellar operon FliA
MGQRLSDALFPSISIPRQPLLGQRARQQGHAFASTSGSNQVQRFVHAGGDGRAQEIPGPLQLTWGRNPNRIQPSIQMSSASHEIYLTHKDLIERALASVCRRQGLYGPDAEDFSSTARLHLIEDDYAVLRQFQGRSSLPTYLVVVITRQFQDWRNARWGKWRPSAEAKRLGETAVRLETLTVRNGLTLDEAYELLRTHHQIPETREGIEAMAARLPTRHKRSFVNDEVIETMPAGTGTAEDVVMAQEAATAAKRASDALASAMRQLPAQDRLIVRMRFRDNCAIVDIARALRVDPKPLYRRIEKILMTLRQALEAGGLTAADLANAWSQHGFEGLDDGESWGEVRPFSRSGQSPALTGGHRD